MWGLDQIECSSFFPFIRPRRAIEFHSYYRPFSSTAPHKSEQGPFDPRPFVERV